MEDRNLRTFNAISSFIQDLDSNFGKKYKPVALYNRLVSNTTIRDSSAMERHINAFQKFFDANPKYIKSKTLDNDIRVVYSDRVYLNLGHILAKTDPSDHKVIHQHLMTIYTLIHAGTEKGQEALQTLKADAETAANPVSDLGINLPDTAEGAFIKNTLGEMTEQFDNMGEQANPMMMMTNMMQSGFFPRFLNDLTTKFGNGEMNMQRLMSTVTTVITEAVPPSGEEGAQVKDFVNQSMGQMAALTGGEVNPEIQNYMNQLTDAVDANAVGANAVGANAVGANAVGANAVGANAVGANAVGANAVGAEGPVQRPSPPPEYKNIEQTDQTKEL